MSGLSYLTAIGSLRVWEKTLLSEAGIESLLGAPSFASAYGLLDGLGFGEYVAEVKNPQEFETALQMSLYTAKKNICDLVGDKKVLDILWLFADLHNAKVILKSHLLTENESHFDELTVSYGSRSIQKMKSLLTDLPEDPADKWISDAFHQAKQEYTNHKNNPLKAEHVLDSIFCQHMLLMAKKSGNTIALSLLQHTIDQINILASFRALCNKSENTSFLLGGTFSAQDLEQDTPEDFGHRLPSSWKNVVINARSEFQKAQNFSVFENLIDDHILKILRPAKTIIDGPEPLIAYFLSKQREAKVIRTILVGKRAGISEDMIRQSLPSIS